MTIKWNDAYRIGNPTIDAQHQELFRNVNAFLDARGKSELTLAAMALYSYTREHFAHEEKLMREIDYPAIKIHINQHNDLIARLNELSTFIANETLLKADWEEFLGDWLTVHIRTSDTRLAAYVAGF